MTQAETIAEVGMDHSTREVTLRRTAHSLLPLDDLAQTAGVHPELAAKFIAYGQSSRR